MHVCVCVCVCETDHCLKDEAQARKSVNEITQESLSEERFIYDMIDHGKRDMLRRGNLEFEYHFDRMECFGILPFFSFGILHELETPFFGQSLFDILYAQFSSPKLTAQASQAHSPTPT